MPKRLPPTFWANMSRTSSWLGIIIFLAIVLRVGVAVYLGDVVDAPPLLTDQRSYHGLGERVATGYGFSFARSWYPFTPPETPTAHWSFLYSLFVAGVYFLFGVHPLTGRIIQAILGGLLLPWLTYRLATTALPKSGPRIPLLAALCAAIYLYFVLYAATLMTETFYIAALLWSLERSLQIANWLKTTNKPIPWSLIGPFGLSLGIATLLRQAFLPWAVVVFAYLLLLAWQQKRLRVGVGGLFPAGIILVLSITPFTIRNYLVYNTFLLLNSNTGYAMYSAQHPLHGTQFQEFTAAPLPADLPPGNEATYDRFLLKQGIQFVWDDPGRYILLSLSRIRAYFEFWPTPDSSLINNIGRVGSFGLFLPFILYGLLISWPNKSFTHHNTILYLFILFYSLLHIFTWAMVRYRLPVDAVLLIFAAIALDALADAWQQFQF